MAIEIYWGLTNTSQLKHMPRDLWIMVSARMLLKYATSPRSVLYKYISEYDKVFLDSGAFGSAQADGGYQYTCDDYLELVDRIQPHHWATMDFPCEPNILMNMSVDERIERTIENTIYLQRHPSPGFLPVVQGWELGDYALCLDLMSKAGIGLQYIGIGSVCRRCSSGILVSIVRLVAGLVPRAKLHGFGIKLTALKFNHREAQA